MVDKKETQESWFGEPQSQDIIKVKIKDLIHSGRYNNKGIVSVGKKSVEDIEKEKKEWKEDTNTWARIKRSKFLFFLPGGGVYPWERLKSSIERNGYLPEKYGYILVREKKDNRKKKWVIINGNHRLKVLKELYGDEHVINVRRTFKTEVPDFKNQFLELPLMFFPALIFFVVYLLGSLLLTGFTIFLTLSIFKDKNDSKHYLTDIHPLKGLGYIYKKMPKLYELIITIYYNLGYVIAGIILLFFVYNIFSNYWVQFFIMLGITLILSTIIRVVIDKLKLDKTPETLTLKDSIQLLKKNDK
tara:strand:- start:2384 stop:3286 length:903 start_codon:yes stop_codon:yes gene_type:complete